MRFLGIVEVTYHESCDGDTYNVTIDGITDDWEKNKALTERGQVFIPAGSMVSVDIWGVHMNRKLVIPLSTALG